MKKVFFNIAIGLLLIFIVASSFVITFFSIEHYDHLQEAAQKYEVNVFLLAAIARVESNFDENAASNKGAIGVMQVLPSTAFWMSEIYDLPYQEESLYEAGYNIDMGTRYFSYLLEQYSGERVKALAAYNAGNSNVNRWLREGIWDGTEKDIDNIPYKETRRYIKKVEFFYKAYLFLYE